jgi:hypothetical protein
MHMVISKGHERFAQFSSSGVTYSQVLAKLSFICANILWLLLLSSYLSTMLVSILFRGNWSYTGRTVSG